jgi:CheY-like chemotaxis protein
VVEDDPDIRESIKDALEDQGYRVATAVNGRDGLRSLGQMDRPCTILLDLMMPVMSGGEFVLALRQTEILATIPIIVVSAWPDEAAKLQDQTQGYVKKPIELQGLLDAVARFCAGDATEAEVP